jgi:hypothetical protein
LQLLQGISKVKRIQKYFSLQKECTKENVHPTECGKKIAHPQKYK